MGGSSYAYDGAGNRISQTVGVDVTQYLLDLQPGLATVLQATQDTDTTRYLHAQRGIHSQQDASDQWTWMLQDGLGSVRNVVDESLSVLESRLYEPYGTPFGASGTSQTVYGFTGEPTDGNELVYLRARYYAPSLGVFTGLDPFEGMAQRPMSLNGYSWVEGNVVNAIDSSGLTPTITDIRSGEIRYSCRCGWLDAKHINSSKDFAHDIFNALSTDINWHQLNIIPGLRVIHAEMAGTFAWSIKDYIVNDSFMTADYIKRQIGLGMHMDLQWGF